MARINVLQQAAEICCDVSPVGGPLALNGRGHVTGQQ